VNERMQRTVHQIAAGQLRSSLETLRQVYDDLRAASSA